MRSIMLKVPHFSYEDRDQFCHWVDLPEHGNGMLEKYGLWVFGFQRKVDWKPIERITPRYFKFYGISHLISGKGYYWRHDTGSVELFNAGNVLISTPDFIHSYGGADNVYSEDHICFCGPIADKLFDAGIIQNGLTNIGEARRLLPIIELLQRPTFSEQLKASLMLQDLLLHIHTIRSKESAGNQHGALLSLISQIEQNPSQWWLIEDMAAYCNLSISQFRRVFKAKTGMKPKLYIDNVKMLRAAEDLCISGDIIGDIAQRYGYSDPYHFSRRFKQIMGLSPQKYRSNNQRSS